ncbi:MAG TPA: type VI secretion system tip protein VgrG, partial [Flavobacteriales bacterium]|nr:type VI secretion system tip protein VgrG [Flavobacteriales bacterium]
MASDNIKSGGNATIAVKVGGNPVPDQYSILSVNIEKRVNKIATARIVILDGEPDTGLFPASSSGIFVPGAAVVIEAGYDSTNAVIFQGIITNQALRVDEVVGSALEVVCRDAAIKMVIGRKCLSFSKQKDSDIISSIIGTYSGLTADVASTTTQWPEQIQYYATDWDFILSRAEANGLIVTTLNGTVSVKAPDANSSPVLIAKYGDNILQFNADLDSITQLASVTSSTWDFTNQAISTGQANNNFAGPGNLSCKTLSDVVGLSSYQLQTSAPLQNTDLTDWSKAQLVKSEYAKIQGEIKFQGTSLVDPGKYITVQGMGDRFNGDHLISGVKHDYAEGNWLTEVSIGLTFNWFTEEPDVVAPPASGLLPGVRGLLNATVKKIDSDPDTQYRILVTIPMIDPNGEGIWARLTNFYSTNGAGAFFLPEVGDEVIVGFLNEDPRYPVILGSVYSSTKLKPFQTLAPNEKNSLKAIVSKTGLTVQFDDENKIITVVTP